MWVGAENKDIDPNAWVDVNIDMDTGRFTFQVPFPERYTANLVWKATITRYKPSPQWTGCKMFVNSVGPVFCVIRIGFSTDTPVLMDVFVRIMEPASWLSRISLSFYSIPRPLPTIIWEDVSTASEMEIFPQIFHLMPCKVRKRNEDKFTPIPLLFVNIY